MKNYEVDAGFKEKHPTTLAFYCSDGRFTVAVNQLMTQFDSPHFDTVNLPGGPALLDSSSASLVETETARAGTSFLIKGHHIERVFLIAHDGCGYYRRRYDGQSDAFIKGRQLKDLQVAGAWLNKTHPSVKVQLYTAVPQPDGKVRFVESELVDPTKLMMIL